MSELQNTPEWHAARCGKLTASRIADALAKTKSGWGASRATYLSQLVYERVTGKPFPSFQSKAMEEGSARQPEAIAAYEFRANCDVEEVGFVPHPAIKMSGSSPDGRVGRNGLVEFKCPTFPTHFDTLLGASIGNRYILQMQWQMACDPDREWCDWVSFFPSTDLPDRACLFIKRVPRDDLLIKSLEDDARKFLEEVDQKTQAFRSEYFLRKVLEEAAA